MTPTSLEGKLGALLFLMLALGAVGGAFASEWVGHRWAAISLVLICGAVPTAWLAHRALKSVRRLLRALTGAVASYRDGDFSLSLTDGRRDELGEIIAAHNALGVALRQQRQDLVQRELLLETVVQNSPAAIFLVDSAQRIAYTNSAARHLLGDGRSFDGAAFAAVLERCREPLKHALLTGLDGLFPVKVDDTEETYHLAQQRFLIQGRPHRLILMKRLTRELSRQEVAVWKKLIRVLSHELNNSLAPISSLAHTGAEMLRRSHYDRLIEVFDSISERSRHLQSFIEGYASFARLPAPRPCAVEWKLFIDRLSLQWPFKSSGQYPLEAGWFDPMQMTQALINLLKNAHESGSAAEDIDLIVEESTANLWVTVTVRDRGSGMSEAVLANALLPFYSTKRTGTGLGLPLAREIIEAHGGTIALSNREGGGLCARVVLPGCAVTTSRFVSSGT
jgi:nitrogen fixation/metabolism regulation signal transduction histidine kinase